MKRKFFGPYQEWKEDESEQQRRLRLEEEKEAVEEEIQEQLQQQQQQEPQEEGGQKIQLLSETEREIQSLINAPSPIQDIQEEGAQEPIQQEEVEQFSVRKKRIKRVVQQGKSKVIPPAKQAQIEVPQRRIRTVKKQQLLQQEAQLQKPFGLYRRNEQQRPHLAYNNFPTILQDMEEHPLNYPIIPQEPTISRNAFNSIKQRYVQLCEEQKIDLSEIQMTLTLPEAQESLENNVQFFYNQPAEDDIIKDKIYENYPKQNILRAPLGDELADFVTFQDSFFYYEDTEPELTSRHYEHLCANIAVVLASFKPFLNLMSEGLMQDYDRTYFEMFCQQSRAWDDLEHFNIIQFEALENDMRQSQWHQIIRQRVDGQFNLITPDMARSFFAFLFWSSQANMREISNQFLIQNQLGMEFSLKKRFPKEFMLQVEAGWTLSEVQRNLILQEEAITIEQFMSRRNVSKNFACKVLLGLLMLRKYYSTFNQQRPFRLIGQLFSSLPYGQIIDAPAVARNRLERPAHGSPLMNIIGIARIVINMLSAENIRDFIFTRIDNANQNVQVQTIKNKLEQGIGLQNINRSVSSKNVNFSQVLVAKDIQNIFKYFNRQDFSQRVTKEGIISANIAIQDRNDAYQLQDYYNSINRSSIIYRYLLMRMNINRAHFEEVVGDQFQLNQLIHYVEFTATWLALNQDANINQTGLQHQYITVNATFKHPTELGQDILPQDVTALQKRVLDKIHKSFYEAFVERLYEYEGEFTLTDWDSLGIAGVRVYSLMLKPQAFQENLQEAYSKLNIQHEKIYRKTKLAAYIDFIQFPCCFQLAGFAIALKNKIHFNVQFMHALYARPEIIQNRWLIDSNNVAQIFEFIAVFLNIKIVLWNQEQQKLFQHCDQIQNGELFVIYYKKHVWACEKKKFIAQIKQLKKLIEDDDEKVFAIRVSKFDAPNIKKKQFRTAPPVSKIFYDIETAQASGEIMQPLLLCAKFSIFQRRNKNIKNAVNFKLEQQKSYWHSDCIIEFIIDLLVLQTKMQQHTKCEQLAPVFIYGHNNHRFDDMYLLPALFQFFSTSVKVTGSVTNVKLIQFGGNYFIRDMINLIPGKLKNIGKTFNTSNKIEFDAGNISEEKLQNEKYKKDLEKYCQRDVQVLEEIYFAFLQKLQQIPNFKGNFAERDIKSSLPATALHIFQKFFYKSSLYKQSLYGNFPDYSGLLVQFHERNSYFGGYTQVFSHAYHYEAQYIDVVSMYPSILVENKVPISTGRINQFNQPQELVGEFLDDMAIYVLTKFQFNENAIITNLPVRNKKTSITIYPRQFKAGDADVTFLAVWGFEIQLAIDLGLTSAIAIKKIQYETKDYLFRDYMLAFFKLKDQAAKKKDEGLKCIAKLFLNSLYGKMGQHNESSNYYLTNEMLEQQGVEGIEALFLNNNDAYKKASQNIKKIDPTFEQEHIIKHVRKINSEIAEVQVFNNYLDLNSPGSLIRIASFTTAKARTKLISAMQKIGCNNIYYCDTDSIVCKAGAERCLNNLGDNLGQFSYQFPNQKIIECGFASAKCYFVVLETLNDKAMIIEDYVKFKGVRSSLATKNLIKELKDTGQCQLWQEQWQRKFGGVEIMKTVKESILHTKRFVQHDGSTRPFKNYNEFLQFYTLQLVKFNYI